MEGPGELWSVLARFVPLLAVLAASSVALAVGHFLLIRRAGSGEMSRVGRQVVMLLVTGAALVAAILAWPMDEATRGQLLSLLGLVLTAVIAFSSTTFVANAMAGLMLRAVRNFQLGDFVRVGEQFGRVTERGLFHTEIQTADRDLTTLPNLYLVNHPMTVVRASGTIVSAELSLGYDVGHARVEPLLLQAAREAGLAEPFVQVLELGNFAITYRAAGFLAEVKQLITARSNLRASILDTLHDAGIEIVSPTFMNQRQLAPQAPVLPEEAGAARPRVTHGPEALVFDKAERAGAAAALRAELLQLDAELAKLDKERAGASDETQQRLELERARLGALRSQLAARVEAIDEDPDGEEPGAAAAEPAVADARAPAGGAAEPRP